MYLYADDTATFVRAKSIELINRTLNREMAQISKWLEVNLLTEIRPKICCLVLKLNCDIVTIIYML